MTKPALPFTNGLVARSVRALSTITLLLSSTLHANPPSGLAAAPPGVQVGGTECKSDYFAPDAGMGLCRTIYSNTNPNGGLTRMHVLGTIDYRGSGDPLWVKRIEIYANNENKELCLVNAYIKPGDHGLICAVNGTVTGVLEMRVYFGVDQVKKLFW